MIVEERVNYVLRTWKIHFGIVPEDFAVRTDLKARIIDVNLRMVKTFSDLLRFLAYAVADILAQSPEEAIRLAEELKSSDFFETAVKLHLPKNIHKVLTR